MKCRLCDEFIPENKPFPDMTVPELRRLLDAFFEVVDSVEMLHLSGGGEPFLNKNLAEMIDLVFEYETRFERFMTFTNGIVPVPDKLFKALSNKPKLIVQNSDYGNMPERSEELRKCFAEKGINFRVNKYYGNNQDYGGWVDFGPWDSYGRTQEELAQIFANCGITKHMRGNWRTRDGKVHWCQRSQRGMELGLLPENSDDYVDLFSSESREQKQNKFRKIEQARYLLSCDHCSGNHGTEDVTKRFPAGEQL
jgi:hypothetical protein